MFWLVGVFYMHLYSGSRWPDVQPVSAYETKQECEQMRRQYFSKEMGPVRFSMTCTPDLLKFARQIFRKH